MGFLRHLPFAALLSAVGLFAAPSPNSVQNPGSNTVPGLPNYGIAQGSVFIVYGSGLGPSTIMGAPSLPLQQTLGGTSISITVNGTTVNALMSYTYATQVAAILPSNTPAGTGTLTVTYNGQNGATPITVVTSNVGILSQNETGTGPAIATHVDNTTITGTNTAYTGEEIVIWGTGLGPLPAGVSDASGAGASGGNIGDITIWVGGVQVPSASVGYHGRNPSDPGLDQINFTIPAGVSGCYVSLVVQTGNEVSNTTSLAIAATRGNCSDASGISFSSFTFPNGTERIGTLSLSQISISAHGSSENIVTGSARFEQYTPVQLTGSGSFLSSFPSVGSCIISIQYANSSSTPTLVATGLDAGTPLVLSPPSGSSVNLTGNASTGTGYYSTALGALTSLSPGTWQFTGPGGANVGAFTASLKVPVNFTWANEASVTGSPISRAQGLTLTWSGGDPASYVIIEGSSINDNPVGSSTIGSSFFCIAPEAPLGFTIPASVLLSLPATGTTENSAGILLLGSATSPQPFSASGLDAGYAEASVLSGALVAWQ